MIRAITCLTLTFLSVAVFAGDGNVRRVQAPVPNVYIVTLNRDQVATSHDLAVEFRQSKNIKVSHEFRSVFKGFGFVGSDAAARAIAADPRIDHVQEASAGTVSGLYSPSPSWGLDRVNQRQLPLDDSYGTSYPGFGVTLYIIDSGVVTAGFPAGEFDTRISYNENFVPIFNPATGQYEVNPQDYYDQISPNGHGTQVASIAAGATHGLATSVNIVNLRAFDATGRAMSSVQEIAAIDRMVERHVAGTDSAFAVANLSWINFGIDYDLEFAVMSALNSGIIIAAAAGNGAASACNQSPSRMGDPSKYQDNPYQHTNPGGLSVITVGATTEGDAMQSNSNYGPCVDIFAPAVNVQAIGKTGLSVTFSDTSAATPHVAAVAAIYLQQTQLANSPSAIEGVMKDNGTRNVLTGLGLGSPNLLLWQGIDRIHACCN